MRYSCHHQGHAGSKTLLQQNPPVLNWVCQLTHVVLYGSKMVVVVVINQSVVGAYNVRFSKVDAKLNDNLVNREPSAFCCWLSYCV